MPSYYSRSRSRSRGRFDDGRNRYSYYHHRSRTRSRSRSRSHGGGGGGPAYHDEDMCRLHVADLTPTIGEKELEKAFGQFGRVREIWTAKNPPCFGFVVFETKEEAARALREMDQRPLGDSRIKVTVAKPRNQRRKPFDPNMRCYQCGQRGHFSRDCDYYSGGGGGGGSSRYQRGRSGSRSRGGRERHYSSRSRHSRGRSYSPRER